MQERDFIFVEDVCKIFHKNMFKIKKEIKINTNKFLRVIDIKNLLDKISYTKKKSNIFRHHRVMTMLFIISQLKKQ